MNKICSSNVQIWAYLVERTRDIIDSIKKTEQNISMYRRIVS